MTVLGIDTSGKVASCAIMQDNILLGETSVYTKLTHSQVTLPLVKQLVSSCNLDLSDIDCVVVSNGPGSYTGLRIGIAAVKGICFPNKPCIGVSTLEALAYNCASCNAVIFSVIAARPGLVYFGAYDCDGNNITNVVSDHVAEINTLTEYATRFSKDIILVGDAASNIKTTLFSDSPSIRVANPADRLQKASSVCMCAMSHHDEWSSPEKLVARYLQVTKAEKDLKEGNLAYGGATHE